MTGLLERLRHAKDGSAPFSLWDEAADRIEALEAAVKEARRLLNAAVKKDKRPTLHYATAALAKLDALTEREGE